MNTIAANLLKTKGVSAIESKLADAQELIVTVRGKEKYVIMEMEKYNHLRECELEAALHGCYLRIKMDPPLQIFGPMSELPIWEVCRGFCRF